MSHHIYFKRNENEIREVLVGRNEYKNNALYYRINNGKAHYEDPTKYISDIIKKGWEKVDFREYVHIWHTIWGNKEKVR